MKLRATNVYQALLDEPSDMQGHLATLYGWVVKLRPEWVIELGVRHGVSSAALLAGLETNGEGMLWSCDIKGEKEMPAELCGHPRWQFAEGDDRKPDDLEPPPPPRCQLLFIDTSHTEAHTQRELAIYGKRVDPGGVILAHDVDDPACGRAFRHWSLERHMRNKATYCRGLGVTLIGDT